MARIERSPSAMLLHHGIVARTSNSVQAEPAVFGRSSSSAAHFSRSRGAAPNARTTAAPLSASEKPIGRYS